MTAQAKKGAGDRGMSQMQGRSSRCRLTRQNVASCSESPRWRLLFSSDACGKPIGNTAEISFTTLY
jgi:hypothetical protein